jgi:adenylate kinase family enzyme
MTKVAVIGNAGGGKSALSRKLSQAQSLPLHEVDRVQFRPGWVPTPAEDIKAWHDDLMRQDRWLIDGWGGWDNIEARFAAADTIILVDFPLRIHYWWSIKRQFKSLFRPRPDGPEGCPLLPVTWLMMKVIWMVHRKMRPRLLELTDRYREGKTLHHLRSPKELRRFLREYAGLN